MDDRYDYVLEPWEHEIMRLLRLAAVRAGEIIPITPEEVAIAEEKLAEENIELPERLKHPPKLPDELKPLE